MKFKNLNDVKIKLEENGYYASDDVCAAVFVSVCNQMPLLVDGPPGVGKTYLAKTLSKIFDAELIRLQCYEGIDVSKVIYDINYQKQMLYISLMKDSISQRINGIDFEKSKEIIDKETNFYSDDFILERPLLKAINPNNKNKRILLIDEIDKTDYEIEAMMLETLSEFSVTIPEYGTIECDEENKPVVVLTTNNQRELSEALKRRCSYLYIDYPSIEQEALIIKTQANTNNFFASQLADFIFHLRKNENLKKNPSISESIEWAKVLFHDFKIHDLNTENKQKVIDSLSVLLKNRNDIEKIKLKINTKF